MDVEQNFDLNWRYWHMKQVVKKNFWILTALVLAILFVVIFSSASSATVPFTNGQYVKLGYGVPLAWEGNDCDDIGVCKCDQNVGVCPCGTKNVECGCSNEKCSELRIISDTAHYLVLGQPFILDLEAKGGIFPCSWEIYGTLPEGLDFSEDGLLQGSPAASGVFRVTIRVLDSAGAETSKNFSFLVVEDEELDIATDTLCRMPE